MSQSRQPAPQMFTQVDVSAGGQPTPTNVGQVDQSGLLREMLTALDRNNELLEELVSAMAASQKQRANELNQWKQANPELAKGCRAAAEALSRVQVEYLNNLTEEITDSVETLIDGEFMLNEFIDRYGPRLAHLNGVIQVLAQLSSLPNPSNTNSQ